LTVSDLILAQFGGEVNAKGYNVFDSHVRAIQGDGINFTSYVALIRALLQKKWSMDNFAFGSGGGLLQSMDRDVLDFAFKASAKQKDGEWYDVWKDPYHQGKQSKRGRLKLVRIGGTHGGAYRTVRQDDAKYAALPDLLVQVYQDGEMLVQHNFAEIRRRTLPHPNEVQAVAEAFELGTITDWGDYAGTSAYKG
jgi:nicotinamide phosphoribosyltransferase